MTNEEIIAKLNELRHRCNAWTEYNRVMDDACAELDRVKAAASAIRMMAAWAEYDRVKAEAWVGYLRVGTTADDLKEIFCALEAREHEAPIDFVEV